MKILLHIYSTKGISKVSIKKLSWLLLMISLHGFLSYLVAVYYRNTNFFDIWENPSFVFTNKKDKIQENIRQKEIESKAKEEEYRKLQEEYTQFISKLNREITLINSRNVNIYEVENNEIIDRQFPDFRRKYYLNIEKEMCISSFRGTSSLSEDSMSPCRVNRRSFLYDVIHKADQNINEMRPPHLSRLGVLNLNAEEIEVLKSLPRGEIPIIFDLYRIFPEDFAFINPGVFSGWLEWYLKFKEFLMQNVIKAFLYILYGLYTFLTMTQIYILAFIWICIAAIINYSKCCNNHYCTHHI